ncbi:ABC transporter substrate-binding protein [Spirochaetia bacterium]|nr:ABC transporter substrate-binding protein [Spirochaetia bacterium]
MKKSLWVLAALVLTALVLPALVFATGSKDKAADNYLRLTWWGNTVRDEGTLKVVELFKSQNPGVTIDTETTGWGSYWDKVNTQAASGSLPDLMQHDYAYISQWATRNQLLDLAPYVQNKTIDVSQIPESVLASGRINGKLYGVLLGTTAFGLVYDPAVLQKAGIPVPDSKTWTWKDFERIAETIYQKTGVQTVPLGTVDPQVLFENWIRQTGASIYSTDGKKLGYTDTAVLKEFWDMQLRLLDKGVLVPPAVAFVQGSIEEGAFAKGTSWCDYIWNTQIAATANAAGRPVNLMFLPRIDQYKRPGTYLKPSMFLSISAKTQNPAQAAKLLNFFINDLGANDIINAERGIPAPANVLSYLSAKMTGNQKIAAEFLSQAASYSSPCDPPDPDASGEVRAIFRDVTVQVLTKTITSQEGVTRLMTRANQVLGGN